MYIDFRVTKMMIVEIVLAISDKIRASPSWKGSIRKVQTGICLISNYLLHFITASKRIPVHSRVLLLSPL